MPGIEPEISISFALTSVAEPFLLSLRNVMVHTQVQMWIHTSAGMLTTNICFLFELIDLTTHWYLTSDHPGRCCKVT
jgi:hypothetical protein